MDKTNLETFFKEIGEKIKEAVKNYYPIMQKRFENENPYAVVFYTDSDCVTLSLIVNTYESLKKTDAEYNDDDDDDETTKWFPNEWEYWDDSINSGMQEIAEELSKKNSSIADQVIKQRPDLAYNPDLTDAQRIDQYNQLSALFEEYRFTEQFLETVISAFQELIKSDVFGLDPDEVVYFITMSDDNRAEEIENNSAKALNSKKVYEKFLKRFD